MHWVAGRRREIPSDKVGTFDHCAPSRKAIRDVKCTSCKDIRDTNDANDERGCEQGIESESHADQH